jgi:hypothetical protein
MTYRWVPIMGKVDVKSPTDLFFKGEDAPYFDLQSNAQKVGGTVGQALCDARGTDGIIQSKIKFLTLPEKVGAGLTLAADPATGAHLTAMLGMGPLCSLRGWSQPNLQDATSTDTRFGWKDFQVVGNQLSLRANHAYEFRVVVRGSRVVVEVDGVTLINFNMQTQLPTLTPGAWFLSQGDVEMSDFAVNTIPPKAFIVMEFSQTFDELYAEVIKPLCQSYKIAPVRADERHGPGLILHDIEQQIIESNVVIADVSPLNANVFYEVGYAHALHKPTILLAQRGTKLPFDIAGLRTIFYENTISGKRIVDEQLRKHLDQVLNQTSLYGNLIS